MAILSALPAIASGVGAVAGLFGSRNKQTTTTTNDPWSAQQPYLKQGFQGAQGIYDSQKNSPYFQGQTFANMAPNTIQALQGIYGYGAQGNQNASTLTGAGGSLVNSGANGLQDAQGNLSGFNPQDPTQQNIQNAGQYADNPYLSGQIDAASRDVKRNLSEVTLPGMARGADGNGNLNSSRTGIAEGIALRGAQDQIGDISSNLRSQAYQNGLSLSEQARSTNQGDWLNSQAQAGSLSGQASQIGANDISSGQGLFYNNQDAQAAAGNMTQQNTQAGMNDAFNQWQNQQQYPWQKLQQYQQAISGNYGGTQTSTAPQQSAIQGALGGATAGLGLYSNFQQMMQQNALPAVSYNSNGLY